MISNQNKIYSFLNEEDGTTAVEYAVMLALILLACIGGVLILGNMTNTLFTDSSNEINTHFGN